MHLREKKYIPFEMTGFRRKMIARIRSRRHLAKIFNAACQNCRKNANFLREVLFEKDDKSEHTCDDKLQRIQVE